MNTFEHLHPDAAAAMLLPEPQRIAFGQADRWIGYDRAKQVIEKMTDTLAAPPTARPENFLLVGRSGNGKSAILEHFARRHPLMVRSDGSTSLPVVQFTMPSTPSDSNVLSAILWALNIGHRESDRPERKLKQVVEMLRYVEARALAIDEFNHVVNAGKDGKRLLATLKNLTTMLRIPIIAAGTEAALNAINSEDQATERFTAEALYAWQLNEGYRDFVATYETLLPLAHPSGLADSRTLLPQLYAMAGPAIGGTVRVMKLAAREAIRSKKECIDAAVLAAVKFTRPKQIREIVNQL